MAGQRSQPPWPEQLPEQKRRSNCCVDESGYPPKHDQITKWNAPILDPGMRADEQLAARIVWYLIALIGSDPHRRIRVEAHRRPSAMDTYRPAFCRRNYREIV